MFVRQLGRATSHVATLWSARAVRQAHTGAAGEHTKRASWLAGTGLALAAAAAFTLVSTRKMPYMEAAALAEEPEEELLTKAMELEKLIEQYKREGFMHFAVNPVQQRTKEHLIWKVLHGPGMFEQAEMFYNKATHEMIGVFHFGGQIVGHTDIVHGGAIATAFDEVFGWLSHLGGQKLFTANLSINYRKPVPVNSLCIIRVKLEKTEGRKVHMVGTMISSDGVLHAESTSLFIVPKSYKFKDQEKYVAPKEVTEN